ncbi:hypothetical protein RDI58_001890 [Solanum bulbocastanum]|uniref:Uncharacterized protein n=1 Tax=Solanum bulbocastanum TaxID=147425 RepID=A0AAN8YQL9_SOLBU
MGFKSVFNGKDDQVKFC